MFQDLFRGDIFQNCFIREMFQDYHRGELFQDNQERGIISPHRGPCVGPHQGRHEGHHWFSDQGLHGDATVRRSKYVDTLKLSLNSNQKHRINKEVWNTGQ